MRMNRTLDDVLSELQDAIEAYKRAVAQYTNEKKQRISPEELEHRLELFRVNTPFLSAILNLARELETLLSKR